MSSKPIPTFPENPWGRAIGAVGPNRQRCINPAVQVNRNISQCQLEARIECGFCHLVLFCSEHCRIACQAVHNNICLALRIPPPTKPRSSLQVPNIDNSQQWHPSSGLPLSTQPILKANSQPPPNNNLQPRYAPNAPNQSHQSQARQSQDLNSQRPNSSQPSSNNYYVGQLRTATPYPNHRVQIPHNSYKTSAAQQLPTPAPTPPSGVLRPVQSRQDVPSSGPQRGNDYRVPAQTALWLQQQASNSEVPRGRHVLVHPATATYPIITAVIARFVEATDDELKCSVIPWAYPQADYDEISEVKHWGPYPIPAKGPRVSVRGGTARFPRTDNPELESDDEYRPTEDESINKKARSVGRKSEAASSRRNSRRIVGD